MKIIDLLNKIANGEEVPKKIRFDGTYWEKVCGEKYTYYIDEGNDNDLFIYFFRKNLTFNLNDEIEIIEDKPEPKPITKKDLEALGYAFGEMKKALQNGWDKSLNNEPFKEDEKIKTINDFTTNVGVVDESNVEEYIHILFEQETILYFKINEIIDVINKEK